MDWETSSASASGPSRSRSGTSGPSFLDRLTGAAGAASNGGTPGPGYAPTSEYAYSTYASEAGDVDTGPEVFTQQQLSQPEAEDDLRLLERAWIKERGVAAVLQWEGELVDSVLDKVEQQGKMLSLLRADPATSEEEHFRLVLVQTEMERAKYVVRSYVRARLHKVEKYAKHLLTTSNLLSGAERQHAERYAALVDQHFTSSVLDSLPAWLRGTEDTGNDGTSMVPRPDPKALVLVHCSKDCGEIALENGGSAVLSKGTSHIVQWGEVERWVGLGWAEVL